MIMRLLCQNLSTAFDTAYFALFPSNLLLSSLGLDHANTISFGFNTSHPTYDVISYIAGEIGGISSNHCLYGIICHVLILSVRPGLSWMVTVPLTWTCTMLYGPLVLSPNFLGFHFFLSTSCCGA
jgi:hypothetical protein